MKSARLHSIHLLLGWALVIAVLYLVCFKVPVVEKTLRESYLIFFYHFPSAILCLLFFVIGGAISARQLKTGSLRVDLMAASAIEIGFFACTICLATGMVWADAAWGKPWIWHDKRLLSVGIMWLCYAAHILFRTSIDNREQRARFSSVLGILFALNVPIVWFAIRIFGKVSHPRTMAVTLDGEYMKVTQWFGVLAFFVLYTAFWRLRYRGLAMKSEIERLEGSFETARI